MIQLQAGITRPVDEREIDSARVLPNNNVYQSCLQSAKLGFPKLRKKPFPWCSRFAGFVVSDTVECIGS
jgi:hypothetical protein